MKEKQGEGEEPNGLLRGLEKKSESVTVAKRHQQGVSHPQRNSFVASGNLTLVEGGERTRRQQSEQGNEGILHCFEKMK